jgi:hypothetical protein
MPEWTTIANTIGSFGVGSLVTQYFTARQRRKEWTKDNHKQEWRELISRLSQNSHYILNYGDASVIPGEQEKILLQAGVDGESIIRDRIFIAPRLQEKNILERWRLFVTEMDWSRKAEYWESLHATLVAAARKDLNI